MWAAAAACAIAACGGASAPSSGEDAGTDGSTGDASRADASADAGSCTDQFFAALDKSCTVDGDCALANHDDCCGTLVVAIRAGTQAAFATAEQAFLACETGCGARGCAHPDTAEDGKTVLASDGGGIVAKCDSGRCSSHVQ